MAEAFKMDWRNFDVEFNVRKGSERQSAYSDYSREDIPAQLGKLVPQSMRRLKFDSKGLFWSGTSTPAYLGLLATGDAIRPAELIANHPSVDSQALTIKIAEQKHTFGFLPAKLMGGQEEHRPVYGNDHTDMLSSFPDFNGQLVLHHETTIDFGGMASRRDLGFLRDTPFRMAFRDQNQGLGDWLKRAGRM